MIRIRYAFAFVAMLFIGQVNGQESNNEAWQVHGFVAQGLIDVDGSSFVNNDGALSAELTEIGINGSYQLNDYVRITGQAVYLDGGNRYVEGARIDYALLDFGVFQDDKWLVNLYLGRFKNNNWLYSSTRDVPHARPSIILPQSKYFDGFRDIAMGSDGISAKVVYSSENYGDFDFYFSYGSSSLETEDVKLLLGDLVKGKGKQRFDAQASLYWQPLFSPWQLGVSLLDSDFYYERANSDLYADGLFSFQQLSSSFLYEGEKWEFSGEITQSKFTQNGFYFEEYSRGTTGLGAYVQSRFQYNNQLSLLARVEKFYADEKDKNGSQLEKNTGGAVPSYFGYQNDITVGSSFMLADNMRVDIEHHWVEGTSRLTPVISPNKELNNQRRWSMWAVQFMYWF
ncbi:hypothetical protein Q4493_05060 [Colwellia sp. 1_MG-2023]|uniref:hypothetical protein n=1 Tax=Colwellia sp. 1_MG-2023 TaxID=3062649 RepID=UPI0026E2E820|nr:hypothetical protein [Colwellia sp. 1_MG-2023]MDO6445140.1 hypothetical protein [Colwellia sp. 1_MG-2023]